MVNEDLVAEAEAQVKQRNVALAQFAKKAEAQAAKIAENAWVSPLDSYHLSAGFGAASYLWSHLHTGQDLARPIGSPIHSIANGVVTETGYDGSYGNKTVVTLDDGTEIWYCHQTSYLVSVGDVVRGGETIGTVGSTGNSTGPHLHIEVRPGGGDPVDPMEAFLVHGITLLTVESAAPSAGSRRLEPLRPTVSSEHELLDRRVAQQQPLDALRPEVDRRDGLVGDALDGDDRAEAERVVHAPGRRAPGTGSRGPAWPWPRRRRAAPAEEKLRRPAAVGSPRPAHAAR